MRFFIDTEFIEYPCTIDLISIALVREDGKEFYAESTEVDWSHANPFVKQYVRPQLVFDPTNAEYDRRVDTVVHRNGLTSICAPRQRIADEVRAFVFGTPLPPEFWGYYADYDWVVFCWLFGAMVDLPLGWPMYCRDLKQLADDSGVPPEKFPAEPVGAHNALADARWNAELYAYLDGRNHGRG